MTAYRKPTSLNAFPTSFATCFLFSTDVEKAFSKSTCGIDSNVGFIAAPVRIGRDIFPFAAWKVTYSWVRVVIVVMMEVRLVDKICVW